MLGLSRRPRLYRRLAVEYSRLSRASTACAKRSLGDIHSCAESAEASPANPATSVTSLAWSPFSVVTRLHWTAVPTGGSAVGSTRSEEHTSEIQSLMRN